jgi:hypothetical protein
VLTVLNPWKRRAWRAIDDQPYDPRGELAGTSDEELRDCFHRHLAGPFRRDYVAAELNRRGVDYGR